MAAIGEMRKAGCASGAAPDKELETLKKGELAGVATVLAQTCGWLPPELRHPAYKIGHKPAATPKNPAKKKPAAVKAKKKAKS